METSIAIHKNRALIVAFCFVAIAVALFLPNQTVAKSKKQPNILVIVADDMGLTDIGPLGGEIPTPNIDALATQGVTFTRFYTSFLCSPTRAMLLTGMDNHKVGFGAMAEFVADNQVGKPGYEGYLSQNILNIAELLKNGGYHTYFTGKWHMGHEVDMSAHARGFDRSFALLEGAGSHFDDRIGADTFRQVANYREDGKRVTELPRDFFSTDFYTDRMIDYIDGNISDGKPFFGYLAYTAPHWPLQVPNKYLDKYKDKYAEGWDVLREQRFSNLKELGVIAKDMQLPPLPEEIPAWNELSKEEQAYEARIMEMYAGMVDNMDHNIGRVLKYLKRRGEYENTFVLFFSDNGADGWMRLFDLPAFDNFVSQFDHSFENIGKKGSYPLYHSGWAAAGEAPFKLFKGLITEGGIRKMAVGVIPGSPVKQAYNHSVVSVMDVLPTALDLAGVKHPGSRFKGRDILEPTGLSFAPILKGEEQAIRGENDVIGMEMLGQRAIVKGDWKLVWVRQPFNNGWELYNVVKDPAEQNNLVKSEPEKYRELLADWDEYVQTNNVVLPEGPIRIVD